MRKTKIIATIGPASSNEDTLAQMMRAGMNVARFNMSHGTYDEQKFKMDMVKRVSENLDTNIALLLDTKGPEIRLGNFAEEKVLLIEGKKFTLTTEDVIGTEERASISYKGLINDVKVGTNILLNDGLVMLEVQKITATDIICDIKNTGIVKSKKSINVPNVKTNMEFLTKKDMDDLKFGVDNNVDYIAASFVRCKKDIVQMRNYVDSIGGNNIKIIAKIENQEGIDNLEEIVSVADGVMVARGDMGVEIPICNLPVIQKNIIKECINNGKIVVTATQMLESMITNPRPTRAEVSDVANAVYDGTSAIMLSGETATGKYPMECIQMMDSIACKVEEDIDYWSRFKKYKVENLGEYVTLQDSETIHGKAILRKQINYSVASSAMYTGAKAIVCVSRSGKTPAVLSSYRPKCPVYVLTYDKTTYRQMSAQWGIKAVYIEDSKFENIVEKGINELISLGYISKGDIVILAGGTTKDSENDSYLSSQTMGAVVRI